MAKIIGSLGSEKNLISELQRLGVETLHNLYEVEEHIRNSDFKFQSYRKTERDNVCRTIEDLNNRLNELKAEKASKREARIRELNEEKENLEKALNTLELPAKNLFSRIMQKIRHWRNRRRFRNLEEKFNDEVEKPFLKLNKNVLQLEVLIKNLEVDIDNEVGRRIAPKLAEKEKIDLAINHAKKLLIGARGEREVVKALSKLPDTFFVINDVVLKFSTPLKTDKGLRFRCQVDHVVVGPTGVFNIETKYWSESSIQNLDLRSPVEQITLAGKGIWRELNLAVRNREIDINRHHWGDPQIRVRNILAMVSAMPDSDFQMVKVLSVDQLASYVAYHSPQFETDEIASIVGWFTNLTSVLIKQIA